MKFSLGTNIKQKLIINAALVATGMIFMLLLLLYSNSKNATYSKAEKSLESFQTETFRLKVLEQEFLSTKSLDTSERYNALAELQKQKLQKFKQTLSKENLPIKDVNSFLVSLEQYQDTFNKVVDVQKRIGLNPKDGLYGDLRSAVHDIETLLKEQNNYKLLTDMLQLRRAEKDFMLRFDLKYLDKFNDGIATLKNNVSGSDLSNDVKNNIYSLANTYQTKFTTLVQTEQKKGLSRDSGIRATLTESVSGLDTQLNTMAKNINVAIVAMQTQTKFIGFGLFVILTIIVLASTYVTSKKVLSPIKEISSVITRVREQSDLTNNLDFPGNDEVSEMGRQFNILIAQFRELINKVISAVQALDDATITLVNNSRENQDSLDLQLKETESVAAAVTQMGATIKEIVSNTEDAAAKALSSNDNAEQGYTQVNLTIDSIKNLSDNLAKAVEDVTELAEESKNVGSVLDVIRGIAEQTNLLALNAAIEAARAGEHGRGFAVVADEVRTLAMRTQESTKEIENIISSLQGRIGSIVSVIDQCQDQGNTSTERAAEAGEKLNSITADVKVIMDMNTQIATAIEQQSKVAEEVNMNVVAIRDVADNSFKRAKDNAESSSLISNQAQILRSFIDKYKV